jgi:RimJ/RimL family protein N-acetyltransferase
MNQIETDRLLLRPWRDTDAPRLAKLANHPEIAHMLASMPHPYSLSDAEDFLERMQDLPAKAAQFAITIKDTPDDLIGGIGYGLTTRQDKPRDEIDFGYWLGVAYWGKGYAGEAAHAVIKHAFEVSSIDRIDTDYLTINPASGRILKRVGFLDRGESDCHSSGSGLTKPSRKMVLTKTHYLAQKAQRA